MTVGSFLHFKGVHADSVSFMPMATSKKEAVKRLCPAGPATDSCWFMPLRLPTGGRDSTAEAVVRPALGSSTPAERRSDAASETKRNPTTPP